MIGWRRWWPVAAWLTVLVGTVVQAVLIAWLLALPAVAMLPLSSAGFIAAQLLLSAALGIALWRWLPADMKKPRKRMMLLLACGNAAVPALAIFAVVAIRIGRRFANTQRALPLEVLGEPGFEAYRPVARTRARGGRIRTLVLAREAPTGERLSALLALKGLPGRAIADLLRQLLGDPLEDIRLLAYGMLDQSEKSISQKIFANQTALNNAQDDDQRYSLNKSLAELHWEMVFQRLVQGEMRRYSAQTAAEHARAALKVRPEDAGLSYLLARICLVLGSIDEGREALARCVGLGYPREKLIPYEAEYAFRERRYEDVAQLFRELPGAPSALRLTASYRYWLS